MSESDRGSVVVIALVVVLLGGIAVSTLTSFNSAMLRASTDRDRRITLERDADSALSAVAVALRRTGANPSTRCPVAPSTVSEFDVVVDCSPVGSQGSSVKAGLVTTLDASSVEAQTLPTWSGGIENAINGAVVINTGTSSDPRVSHLADSRLSIDPSAPRAWSTMHTSWIDFASRHDLAENSGYPTLPSLPMIERPGAQTAVGSCTIYFPGRYYGTTSLVLSGGTHYFASGVYYFERSLAISNGARVVMGQGTHAGCTTDAEAAATGRSPRDHQISGRGAVLLLGGTARLIVQESSLIINERNDSTGISVRTVGFGTSTTTLSVPADTVRLDDGTLVPASAHSVLASGSSTPVSYKASTLSPTTAFAVDIRLNGTSVDANRVVIEGQIFVPIAGVKATSTTAGWAISLTGGIVATRLTTSLPTAPSTPAGFVVGSTLPDATATLVTIDVTATRTARSVTSSAVFAADNGEWSLVGRSRRHRRLAQR